MAILNSNLITSSVPCLARSTLGGERFVWAGGAMVVACVEKQGEGSGEYSAAGAIEAEPIQEILCNTIPKCSGVQRILHATIFSGGKFR